MSLPPGTFNAPKREPREREYRQLISKFQGIAKELEAEKLTELDGLLWDLSYRLAGKES